MLHEIAPHQFCNDFKHKEPAESDYVLIFRDNLLLLDCNDNQKWIPRIEAVRKVFPESLTDLIYLFSIDDDAFYLAMENLPEPSVNIQGLAFEDAKIFYMMQPLWMAFAGATAHHLFFWYRDNYYCGRCAAVMSRSEQERALSCAKCGNLVFPKISPILIVGVIDGNRLLLTRYSRGIYTNLALIAGFIEVGESVEDAIHREALEEAGLKIKNIRYFKSQPWPFSQSLAIGYFADVQGSSEVKIDANELKEAIWFEREDIALDPTITSSLTYDMIAAFHHGQV